ncbi:MAG: dUTP diphosphatase [Oscillospiraceae bacterium]|nr:dUTP diphosphatase [Oscillospiraceae bacterium]
MDILIKKLSENAITPKKATAGSAGFDLCACIDEPVVIKPRKSVPIPTGIAVSVPEGHAAFIFARSGLAFKHGVTPVNCVGVIDSDYRGEVIAGLFNHFDADFTVNPGERIAQMCVMPVPDCEIVEADSLGDTVRGEGGFGSTGV